jgi:hypothetical protein
MGRYVRVAFIDSIGSLRDVSTHISPLAHPHNIDKLIVETCMLICSKRHALEGHW